MVDVAAARMAHQRAIAVAEVINALPERHRTVLALGDCALAAGTAAAYVTPLADEVDRLDEIVRDVRWYAENNVALSSAQVLKILDRPR